MDVDGCLDLDLVGERGVVFELVGAGVAVGAVVVVVVWSVLASWQSASAGRKRLMAM